MASPLISRAPQCMSCVRRMTGSLLDAAPGRQQVRGKKRLAKVTTVKVQLLQNVPGYGRRGAVIPVTAGVMRNIWYPKHMAEYVTATKARELGLKKDTQIEREYAFKSEKERKMERQTIQEEKEEREREEREVEEEEAALATPADWEPAMKMSGSQEPAPSIELDLMSPEETLSTLEFLLPANLDFYRTPITIAPPKRVSPSIAASATTSTTGRNQTVASKTSIYGSVSTSDIAANLKAILAEDEAGSRVVLSAEDISFLEETEDKDRVKHIGVFEIEIKVEGAADSVRRTIKVNAQD